VAGPSAGQVYKGKHGYPCKTDIAFEEAAAKDFAGILIPGGFAPDKMRQSAKVLKLVKEFDAAKKMIAFICHGGWVPISAKVLKGRKATSYIGIKDDMENAGAIWSDEAVVIDKNLISSRTPRDLPPFGKALVDFLS
jgi:protease I